MNFNFHANECEMKRTSPGKCSIVAWMYTYTKKRHMQDKEPNKGLSKEKYSPDGKKLYKCGMVTSLESGSAFPKTIPELFDLLSFMQLTWQTKKRRVPWNYTSFSLKGQFS